jgi:hypothetical protein
LGHIQREFSLDVAAFARQEPQRRVDLHLTYHGEKIGLVRRFRSFFTAGKVNFLRAA